MSLRDWVTQLPDTVGVFVVSGSEDFLVHVAVADNNHLYGFVIDKLCCQPVCLRRQVGRHIRGNAGYIAHALDAETSGITPAAATFELALDTRPTRTAPRITVCRGVRRRLLPSGGHDGEFGASVPPGRASITSLPRSECAGAADRADAGCRGASAREPAVGAFPDIPKRGGEALEVPIVGTSLPDRLRGPSLGRCTVDRPA
jgi:hypothetical protein